MRGGAILLGCSGRRAAAGAPLRDFQQDKNSDDVGREKEKSSEVGVPICGVDDVLAYIRADHNLQYRQKNDEEVRAFSAPPHQSSSQMNSFCLSPTFSKFAKCGFSRFGRSSVFHDVHIAPKAFSQLVRARPIFRKAETSRVLF